MNDSHEYDSYDDTYLTNANNAQQVAQKKELSLLKRREWMEAAKSIFLVCCALGTLAVLIGLAIYFSRKEKFVDRIEIVTREIIREIPGVIDSSNAELERERAESIAEINSTLTELAEQSPPDSLLPSQFNTFTTAAYEWANPTGTGDNEVIVGKEYSIGESTPSSQWCYMMQEHDGMIAERVEILSDTRDYAYSSTILLSQEEFEGAQSLCASIFD